jgi:hypothetical protein
MATETEELRLVVNLIDNATPGVEKIREHATAMGGPQMREAQRRMSAFGGGAEILCSFRAYRF